jgi:exodeoxyribonuclease VII large subunit
MSSVDLAALSVAEYATRIGIALRDVGGAVVEGEVQKPTRTERGMLFFDVTDGDARLACKVFPRDARRLQHQPRHGDLVQLTVDRPDFYAQQGRVSVIVSRIELAGEGELLRRREELLRRLTSDGLCDPGRWKPLPRFPRAVGVIAGRGSDGLADVVRALQDRWPPVHVVTCAARVQGVEAPGELIDALARMQEHPLVDVVVFARGGGSVQDLVAFDDERVCRAVHACATPVVCAVGHTENVPVCNHVTHHAATPSRAPELVVPDATEVRGQLRLAALQLADVPPRLERLRADVRAAAALVNVRRAFDAAALNALAARIDAHAHTFFAERRLVLAKAGETLAEVDVLIDARRVDVDAEARRVAAGTRRQLADHERDYGHALARLCRESARAARRGLHDRADALRRDADVVVQRAQLHLGDAERALRHACDVIAARDFRPRGWLLATRPDGRSIAAASAVAPGARLRLHFGDGQVGAAVETIELQEDSDE